MADAVLVLGEDVTNTAPLLDLALRQAVRNKPKEKTAAMRIPEWDDNAIRNAIQNETGPLFIAYYHEHQARCICDENISCDTR